MSRYRKKPIVVEAEQLDTENGEILAKWCGGQLHYTNKQGYNSAITIPTLEGVMRAEMGDYIIKDIKGEFYLCKPEIFTASYDIEKPV